jgi:hypothetical protein
MPAQRVVLTLSGISTTSSSPVGYPLYIADWSKNPPQNTSVSVVINSTAAAPTTNIEVTNDYTGSSAFISTAATWFSSFASALSSNAFVAITAPFTALRVNATAGSTQQTLTVTVLSA